MRIIELDPFYILDTYLLSAPGVSLHPSQYLPIGLGYEGMAKSTRLVCKLNR